MHAVPTFQIELAAYGVTYTAVLVVAVLFTLLSRRPERRNDALRVLTILFRFRHRD